MLGEVDRIGNGIGVTSSIDDELALAITLLSDSPASYRPLVSDVVPLALAADRLRTLPTQPAAGKVVIQLGHSEIT